MIIKDKSLYLNYVKDIEEKVNNLYTNAMSIPLTDIQKETILKIRVKILGLTGFITELANKETGLIPTIDWLNYQQEISKLYTDLTNQVNQAISLHNALNAQRN